MRAMHWGVQRMPIVDPSIISFLKLAVAKEIEIGLGIAVWSGLVFVIVHFGGLTA